MSRRLRCNETANMLPLAVIALFFLFSVLSFAIDQGIAYAAKARQENALDAVRSACMDPTFALYAKNVEDPGREVAELVVRTAREEGFAGSATVWFYEAAESLLPSSERLWGIGVQLEEDAPTVFARGFGVPSLPVASHKVMVAVPYASERAWRPDERRCGRYGADAGTNDVSFVPMGSLEEYPAPLVEALRSALPERQAA